MVMVRVAYLARVRYVGGDCFRVEEGGGTACIENGSEVEVAVARGEIAEKGNAFVKAECGLCDVPVLS
jgi:hypothetical protein